MAERAVDVFVGLGGQDARAGRLWSHQRGGTESATFVYSDEYLVRPDAYALDPGLPLLSGQHQTRAGQALFVALSDSAPDRWGRRLINRAERRRAERGGVAPRSFGEIDYLLGSRDDMRQGALRFRTPGSEEFLAPAGTRIPPLIELPRLLDAEASFEHEEESDEDMRLLLAGGSSLGGARPKAHVIDARGRVAIAKFPAVASDEWDVVAWEAVTHELARLAGLTVPTGELHRIAGRSVFIVERFDRDGVGRIGYVSAMTLLEAADREPRSYLDIAAEIEQHSDAATRDLRELWARIAFTLLVSNTDDHLRNHGFLKTTTAGWRLAPAFDINPNPEAGSGVYATAIDRQAPRTIETLFELAGYFRLSQRDARAMLGRVHHSARQWGRVAETLGLDAAAMRAMAPAFEQPQATAAEVLLGRSATPVGPPVRPSHPSAERTDPPRAGI